MIKDDLAGLSLFVEVAKRRSFTAAAAALRVTPSAVSQGIGALERRLGVRLLQRTTRSVGLTEAGERFLARLRPALDDVRASFAALDSLRDRPAGTLRLNVPRIASRRFLEPRLAAFLAKYPDIELDVVVDDGFSDLIEGGFDAGIRLGESLERDMIGVRIGGEERSAVVGSPAYFAARGRPKHPRELHTHECINYRRITGGDVYRWEFTEKGKDFDVAVSGRLVCNDADLMTRAAIDGLGLAHVLESMVERELADKRLVRVLADFCPPFPGQFLYYPSRNMTPKLKALVDFLRVKKR
jgi:DNA-binding transcriptional LysR family regulator